MRWPTPVSLAVFLFLTVSCAKQQFPSGGPEDRTAPEVLSTDPVHGSVHVSRVPTVTITFSKRMDRQRTNGAVFVSPSPGGEVRFDWRKNSLRLGFTDSLAGDRTYVVTVGSSASDERNNRLEESFSLAFSTGTALDSGSVSGVVRLDGVPSPGATVVAYGMELAGSTGLFAHPPEYTTQTGSDGTYRLSYVSPGDYLLFAYDDRNRNRKWDPPGEKIGFPRLPALTGSSSSPVPNVDFDMFQRDTVPLRVEEAVISQDRVLRIELSQPVLRSAVSRSRIMLVSLDGVDTVRVDDIYVFSDSSKSLAAPAPDLAGVEAVYLQIDSLRDLWGNEINTIDDTTMLQPPVGSDKRPPSIRAIDPPGGSGNVDLVPSFEVLFDEPIRLSADSMGFSLVDPDSVFTPCVPEQIDLFTVQFTPRDTLRQGTVYSVVLLPGIVSDAAGNANVDPPAGHTIETVNYDSLGSFSGNASLGHIGPGQTPLIFYRLTPNGRWTELEYDQFGHFHHLAVPGRYCFRGFVDRDGDEFLSIGGISPFEYAEPVLFFGDTVTVRARFETEDIKLRIE